MSGGRDPGPGAAEIFARAQELHGDDRAAFLDQACGSDAALRSDVRSMLDTLAAMGDFLEVPAAVCVTDGLHAAALEPGDRVGSYRITRVLGSGGGGTVYEALQANPERSVALKVMRTGLDSVTARARFAREAQILARLEHEDIARIYEAGVHDADGRQAPFFAMEFVADARPLTSYAHDSALDLRTRLELFVRVCRAVQHGHERGIVHRDLKPANLLVDHAGRLRVIDFGVAGIEGGEGRQVIAGTPEYMSPEQCDEAGTEVDARSDVYALGVVLYELLTGRRPHDLTGVGFAEGLRRIREDEPAPIGRQWRGDLEAISARARARSPAQRYDSAAALADDVQRHLDDAPVLAAPNRWTQRARKFARRQRRVLAVGVPLALLAVLVSALAARSADESDRARRRSRLDAYVANLSAAAAALRECDVNEAGRRLDAADPELRNWEWRHLNGRMDTSIRTLEWPGVVLRTGAISADGRLLAATGVRTDPSGHEMRVWDLRTFEVIHDLQLDGWAWALAFSPDATRLAIGFQRGPARVMALDTGACLATLSGHEEAVNRIAFDHSGERVVTASADGTVRTWSARDGACLRTIAAHDDRVIGLALAGDLLATGGREGLVKLQSLDAPRAPVVFEGHTRSVEGVALSPDGSRLVSGSRDKTVRLWDVREHRPIPTPATHTANVRDVAFAPDGLTFATASYDRTVGVFSARTGERMARLVGHRSGVNVVLYSPSGGELVSMGIDGAVKFWTLPPVDGLRRLTGHTELVESLDFSADDQRLVSADSSGVVNVWDLRRGGPPSTSVQLDAPARGAAFDASGRRVLVGLTSAVGALINLDAGVTPVPELRVGRLTAFALFATPSAWDVYSGRSDGALTYTRFGSDARARSTTWTAHTSVVRAVAAHYGEARSGDDWLATGDSEGNVRLWADHGGRLASSAAVASAWISGLAFDPQGRRLAVQDGSNSVRLLDVPALDTDGTLTADSGSVRTLAFSPDGTRLATGADDGMVRLFDVATGVEVLALRTGDDRVTCVTFSHDGRTLAAAGGITECHIVLWAADDGPRGR